MKEIYIDHMRLRNLLAELTFAKLDALGLARRLRSEGAREKANYYQGQYKAYVKIVHTITQILEDD